MIQRAASPDSDPVLEQMTRAIVAHIRPARIVLFGSRARGEARWDSDYDLMVELESELDHRACRSAIDAVIQPLAPGVDVDVIVRKPGELAARCDDPGWLDWDIAREGIVLYPPDAPRLWPPASPPLRVREPSDGPPASVRGWLERAGEDLLAIEGMLTGKRVAWSAVAFHGQQAAEKYLKAILIQRMIHPPHTHKLDELVTAARAAGYALPDLTAECEALINYAVDVRYPEAVPIPAETEGRVLLAAARRILDAVVPLARGS